MCGIAGVLCGRAFADAAQEIDGMVAALSHRGPDDSAVAHSQVTLGPAATPFALALGATRLSLLDLEGGTQPFAGSRGSRLVFNGEVYNWREMREELAADGWEPRTRCDTEIVSEMLERHGAGAVARFDGMFALAFHDHGRLLLARDPFGIKPLYYAWNPQGWLAFASEAKALLRFSRIRPRLSPEALFETRVFGYPLGARSPFAGVVQLEPGTVVSVGARDDGTLKLETTVYEPFPWHGDAADADRSSDGQLADLVAGEFVEAVGRQLVADHPVGIFLSGGIDSAAMLAAALAGDASELHTFSVGDGADLTDLRTARRVAERVGCRHHEIVVGPEQFADAVPATVHAMEAPRPPTGGEFLAREARRHTKAALCGEGSDELFGGYWVHSEPGAFLGSLLREYVSAYRLAGGGDRDLGARSKQVLRWLGRRDPIELARRVWLFNLRDQLTNGHLVPWDHATMGESFELRVPYLSRPLAGGMRSHPLAALQPAGSKPPVRALVQQLLPRDVAELVLRQPKIPFPTSIKRASHSLALAAADIVPRDHRRRHPLRSMLPLGLSPDGAARDPLADAFESLGVLLLDMFVLIFCVHRGEMPSGLTIRTLYEEPSFTAPLADAIADAGAGIGSPVDEDDDERLLAAALR